MFGDERKMSLLSLSLATSWKRKEEKVCLQVFSSSLEKRNIV